MRLRYILEMAFIVLILVGLLVSVAWYWSNIAGYCGETNSFTSDASLIETALIDESRSADFPYTISDRAMAAEYLAKEPDCCAVERWNHPLMTSPFLAALIGQRGIAVVLQYLRRTTDADGSYEHVVNIVNACGRSIDRSAIARNRKPDVRVY